MRTILRIPALAAVVMVTGLSGCSTSGPGGDPGSFRSVVVAEDFWGSVVRQVAGSDIQVTPIIANPNADPHDYEPTAQDAREVAASQYLVMNGIGYDEWMNKLARVNPSGRRVLDVGELLGLADDANPHQWYSPTAVRRFATRVGADLAALDPEHAPEYAARTRAFLSRGLREYDTLLEVIARRFGGSAIGASESIVAPLAAGAGLRLVTPEKFVAAVAEGNEPTRADKAIVDRQIAHHEIKVFVYNRQNATPDVRRLVDAARRANIPVVTVTETMPSVYSTFQAWQVHQLRGLLGALERSGAS